MEKYKLPKGFVASGIHSGVKKKRKDLSLFFSSSPCKIAAMFTKNLVKAAPVVLAQEDLKKTSHVNAIIVNSGNANCMTGERGLKDAKSVRDSAAKALGVGKEKVMVSSTGIIGEYLPVKTIVLAIPELISALASQGINDAADGIMTTDNFRKIKMEQFFIDEKKVTITAIAKGAGMIEPNMATMLCYVVTDANISQKAMKKALNEACEVSFNSITVDGDMSTNDTLMILSNGEACNKEITETGKDYNLFFEKLKSMLIDLAKMIVCDGEGATKLIEVKVNGAKTNDDAKRAAKSVAGSLLVKCAVLGEDPNWGRIASSVGSSGACFNPDKMEIILDGIGFYKNGKASYPKKDKTKDVFKNKVVKIEVDLKAGKCQHEMFSCDISKKYITLNAHYTT